MMLRRRLFTLKRHAHEILLCLHILLLEHGENPPPLTTAAPTLGGLVVLLKLAELLLRTRVQTDKGIKKKWQLLQELRIS